PSPLAGEGRGEGDNITVDTRFEHKNIYYTSVNLGEISKAIDFLKKNKVEKIVFAGRIKRPNFNELSLDKKGKSWLLKLGKATLAGDDALLRAVAGLIQKEGFEVIAGTDLLDGVFLSEGIYSARKPSESDLRDIKIGLSAANKLGAADLGQSVVVRNGEILEEDANGTNALIKKRGQSFGDGGILVKISKPRQDERLDLPAVGPETIEALYENGFKGAAVEADKCIVINKDEVLKRADELGIFFAAVKIPTAKVFIVAGEASGDYLGGRLMEDILKISDERVEFFGVGGEQTEKAGLKKLFSINELSIIGITEVVGKIFRVKKLIDKTAKAICEYRPDVVVTIDSSGFTHRVDKKVKKLNPNIPIIHYVAPPVWAWRPWRAKKMRGFIDKLMTLLPFEPKYFTKYGLDAVFVGHPIATDEDFDRPSLSSPAKDDGSKKTILLLPGSRKSELSRHLPILKDFARLMIDKYKSVKFIIPTIESLKSEIEETTKSWPQKPTIVSSKSQKVSAYYSSDAAVAASGTVTLELARVGLPFVAIYKTSAATYWIVRLLIKVKCVCLVNILVGKNVVPELLQDDCSPENVFRAVEKILNAREAEKQKKAFEKVIEKLKAEPMKAAKVVKSFFSSNN
ncbi:MAG: lipid-A-disaccharide synthase, partial [Holosporaceae bacterium]|nr:lipid-A-disaccharide synthase [Holosporaceae bacterium]